MTITPELLDALERAAKAVVKIDSSSWKLGDRDVLGRESDDDFSLYMRVASPPRMRKHDFDAWREWLVRREHIAACDPPTILALIAALRASETARIAAEAKVGEFEAALAECGVPVGQPTYDRVYWLHDQIAEELMTAEAANTKAETLREALENVDDRVGIILTGSLGDKAREALLTLRRQIARSLSTSGEKAG